jgi:hypothetical protein
VSGNGAIENLYNEAGKNKGDVANLYAEQQALANAAKVNPSGKPIVDPTWNAFDKLPYPGAPHDGGPQDLANQKANIAAQNNYQGYEAALQAQRDNGTFMDKFGPAIAIGLATGGVGSAVGAGVGSAIGGMTGTVIGGAAGGATAAGLTAAIQGRNPLKPILVGGLLGGAGAGLNSTLGSAGLSPTASAIGAKIGTGALSGALSGQGALSGAEGGALSGAGNAVAGSIFNSPGSTVDPQLTNSNNPSTPTVSYDPSLGDPSQSYISDPNYQSIPFQDPSAPGYNPGYTNYNVQGGGSTLGGGYTDNNGNTTAGNLGGSALATFLKGMGGQQSSGNGSNTGILSTLSQLLGGGAGLSQLLGIGVNGAAGAVNSQANQYAAQQYAGQTHFNPYNIQGPGGSTSFNGTTAQSSLNPATQQTYNQLGNLANSSAQSLQGGQQQAAQGYYNNLQNQQRDSNNKYYQNNLDSQFANGVLSSTAGQYQSQAALGNISNQNMQDQTLANNFANTQQQNQLQQLTAGLNGQNQINSQQLQQMSTAGGLGADASGANLQAYKPLAGANANSNLGNILSSIGNQSSNGVGMANNQQNLLQLLGLGGH